MKKKSGFSLEMHLEIGRKLHQMNKELTLLTVSISESYPIGKVKHVGRMLDELSELRSQHDCELFREFPKDAKVQIYYPGNN